MTDEVIRKLFVPIIKSVKDSKTETKEYAYTGILSDDSLDRDDEMMSPELLKEWAKKGSIPGIMNHENKIENYIADFNNLRTVEQDGRTLLVGDIEFFDVPEAKSVELKVIKGKHTGLSISAIPQDYSMVKKEVRGKDKEIKMFTKGELLEGSFIPIQSNRYAQALAFAKSFDLKKFEKPEVVMMEEKIEEEKPLVDKEEVKEEVKTEEVVEEKSFDFKKAFADLNNRLSVLEKSLIKKEEEIKLEVKPEEVIEKPEEENNDTDIEKGVQKEALTTPASVVEVKKEVTLKDVLNKVYGGKE
ncbi:MAG: hypothetical protein WC307_05220 [Candidatus Nanoarchaeia archaeon]|jgi:hypothetical protein